MPDGGPMAGRRAAALRRTAAVRTDCKCRLKIDRTDQKIAPRIYRSCIGGDARPRVDQVLEQVDRRRSSASVPCE